MAKIQIKNSFITSSAQITISSSLVRFSDNIRAKGITGSFSGSFAGSNLFVQGGNSFGTTALLGTNDNQPLVLETNASEKMRVTAAGLVGIGTSNPGTKLQVLGDATVGTPGSGGNLWILGDRDWRFIAGTTGYGVGSGFGLFDNTGGAYRISVDTSGNVGIGTTSPAAKLDVAGDIKVGSGTTSTTKVTGSLHVTGSITLNTSRDSNWPFLISDPSTIGGSSRYQLGKVGAMGFNYPDSYAQLQIIGASGAYIDLGNSGTDDYDARLIYYTNSRLDLTYGTTMTLNSTGVGIGTTAPLSLLDVRSGFITAGTNSSTSGTTIIAGYYTSGYLTSLGTEFSSGGPVLGYAVSPSTSGTGAFLSSTTITIPRSAYVQDGGTHRWYTGAAQSVAIGSAVTTSEKMRMDTNGNVGIGTSSPTAKLQVGTQMYGSAPDANYFVVGNENFSGPGPVGGITGYPTTANRNQITASLFDVAGGWESVNGYHALLRVSSYDKINSTPALTILNNGNLGLGTNSPSHQLTISRPTQAAAYQVNFNTDGGISDGNYTGIRFSQGATGGTELGNIKLWYFTTGATALSLGVRNATQALYVATDGNIGIGTTNPGYKLDIISGSMRVASAAGASEIYFGTLDSTNIYLKRDNNYDLSLVQNAASGNGLYLAGAGDVYVSIDSNNNESNRAFIVQNNSVKSGTELFRVNEAGNVGIGTSSPKQKLDIAGAGVGAIGLTNTGTTGYSEVIFYEGSTVKADIWVNGSTQTNYAGANSLNIWQGSNAPMAFYTNGTNERMRIASDGNVGIGSSSPIAKLDINGTSNFAPNVYHSIGGQKFFAGSGGAYNYIYTGTTTLNFINGSDTSTLMSLLNNGNLGIGTTTPAYKFHIYSGSMYVQGGAGAGVAKNYTSFSRLIFDTDHSDSTRGPNKITLYDAGGTWVGGFGVSSDIVGYYSGGHHVWLKSTSQTAFTEYMRLNSNGNLGIGTSSPPTMLQVVGTGVASVGTINIRGSQAHLGLTTAGGTFKGWYGYFNSSTHGSDLDLNIKTGYAGASNIRISANGDTAAQLFISGSGLVGIGTTTPTARLDVANGGLSVSGWSNNNSGTTGGVEIGWDGSQGIFQVYDRVNANYEPILINGSYTMFYVSGTERARLTSAGNLGIGTTSASRKLIVFGDAAIATNSGGIVLASYDGDTGNIRPSVANGSILISDDSGLLTRGTEFLNGGGLIVQSLSGFAPLEVKSNGNTLMYVTSGGNVGIGTNSPAYTLEVASGTSGQQSLVNFRTADSTTANNAGIQIFATPSATATSREAVMALDADGANASGGDYFLIKKRGNSGTTDFEQYSNASMRFGTNFISRATYDMTIANDGNVGIGTTSPAYRLDVNGGIASGGVLVALYSGNYNRLYEPAGNPGIYLGNNSDPGNYYDNTTHYFRNRGGSSNYAIINSNGNLGIGTSSPVQKLHVVGAVYGTTYGQFGTSVASGTNSSYAVFGSNSAVVGVKINIDSNVNRNDLVVSGSTGNVGIGTSQVLSKLNAYASGSNLSVFRVDGGNGTLFEVTDQLSGSLFSVNDVSGLPLLEVFSNNRVVAGKYGSNALVVSGSSVGIGTSRPSYRLQVSGSFAATTKSFVIKHPDPDKSDKQLVHGVTEGPEHTVFVRGKLENNNIIQLPDYWQYLVDEESITVTLTPNKYYQQLYVKNVTNITIEVGTETDKPINCYYYIVGERKDIPKLITEI